MRSGLKDYICEYEDRLNTKIMNKEFDVPLVDYIVDVWKSLEVLPQINFDHYEYSEVESEININKLMFKRDKKKKKKDRYEVKNVLDDRVGKLTVYLNVSMLEKDNSTGEITHQIYPFKKEMLIPLEDENGYYTLKGKKFYLIWQMVEKSTYTSQSSVTTKSLMPVATKRVAKTIKDCAGNVYTLPTYNVFVIHKETPIILFYMSRGLSRALDFLNLYDVIIPIDTLPDDFMDDEEFMYFPLNNKGTCFIKVMKDMFDEFVYVRAIVASLYDQCMTGKSGKSPTTITLNKLEDGKVWMKKMNSQGSYDRSTSIMQYFDRMLDETTKKILKLPACQKYDIYGLLRWMQEEFNELRLKDNCDLSNKRIRCNEYIASLLTKEFSKRLARIISMGDKATVDNIRELFKFSGDILIQKMHSSGVLRFNDSVNDLDMFVKFKYTSKGPHSISKDKVFITNFNVSNA